MDKIKYWKDGVDVKRLRANNGKIKVMRCKVRSG